MFMRDIVKRIKISYDLRGSVYNIVLEKVLLFDICKVFLKLSKSDILFS